MEAGSALGPYRIDRKLGAGGMGTVYQATGRDGVVAIKVLHASLLEAAGMVERFQREIAIGRRIAHPNVVRTLDGGEIDGYHFLAMEYVEGQTLDDLCVQLERVPEELCSHIAGEACQGLAAIHAAGAIHRDLKPENILITPDHLVKIMDLGVARLADEAARLSQTGAFVGSLQYAAPEQFQGGGETLDGRTDLHSLGLVLYELATGICPYRADDVSQTVKKVLHEEPRRLGEVNPQMSAFFEEVVHCLLAKDPGERFATADELRSVLADGVDGDWWREQARAVQRATQRPLRRIRIPRETAVYGRDGQIEQLRALFDEARDGHGRVVLLSGEAGIGKSRLVDELVAQLQQAGEDLHFLFGGFPPGGAATAEGGFSSAFRDRFGEEGSSAYLPGNAALVPAFDALLRAESAPADGPPLTKGSIQTCFVTAMRALAAERPTVLLIEDLHFAPEEGRGLFTSLAMAVPDHRVLLLGTTRPGVPEEWTAGLTRLGQTRQLELPRLGPKHLVQLLEDTLQSKDLARQLGNQIALKSDGNPFFAFEIIYGLREGQFLKQSPSGTWVTTRIIDEIEIPSSVLDLVAARVSSLSEEERDLLDVASCCGHEFDPTLVAAALGRPRIPVLKRLAQIERAHRLVRASGRCFVFDHHQVQEALYSSLPELLREEYHAALAEALEGRDDVARVEPHELDGALCVALCEHSLKGGRGRPALRYLERARGHLAARYEYGRNVDLAERALAAPGLLAGLERAQLLLDLQRPLTVLGRRTRHEEAVREVQRIAGEIGDTALANRAAAALGTVLRLAGRDEEALALLGEALEQTRMRGDRATEADVHGKIGNALCGLGRVAEAREAYERQLDYIREAGNRPAEARCVLNLASIASTEGRIDDAEALLEEGRKLARLVGDREAEATAIGSLGNLSYFRGHLDEARRCMEQELAIGREMGDRGHEARVIGNVGFVLQAQGDLAGAMECFTRRLMLTRELGDYGAATEALGNVGSVLHAQGNLTQARTHYESYLTMARERGDRTDVMGALHSLGELLVDEGDDQQAKERFEACLAVCEELGFRRGIVGTLLFLGEIAARAGDAESAQGHLTRAADESRAIDMVGSATLARCRLAALPDGDPQDALAAFNEYDSRLSTTERKNALWLLYRATGDVDHLNKAKGLLDESLRKADEATRESMRKNLRLNREISAAWAAR